MRFLEEFKNKETEPAITFQKAIDSRERFLVPPGIHRIDQPLEFGPVLLMKGVLGYPFDRKLNVPYTEIQASSNCGDEPALHRKGLYCKYIGNGKNEWVGPNPEKAGTGLIVQVEDIYIRSLSDRNSALQIYNCSPGSYVKSCTVAGSFRGLECINTFGMIVEGCKFVQPLPDWLDDEIRTKQAWSLICGGHCTVTECNWQGAICGPVWYGMGNRMSGGRIERTIYGQQMSAPNQNPAHLDQWWAVTQSEWFGFTMESNLRHITGDIGHGCSLRSASLHGRNAPQLDRTDGFSEWGINLNSIHQSAEIKNVGVGDKYRQGARIGPGWKNVGSTITDSLE